MPKFMYFNLDQQIKELVIKKKKKITPKNYKNLLIVLHDAHILS